MPAASTIVPGSALVASAASTRSGSFLVNRNILSTHSSYYNTYSPSFVDFGVDTLAVVSNSMPSLLITVTISAYYDDEILLSSNTCLPCVAIVPIIADGTFGRGKALAEPVIVYPYRAASFIIRAPIEKFSFAAWNPLSNALRAALLPAAPDVCWTQVDYTISASQ